MREGLERIVGGRGQAWYTLWKTVLVRGFEISRLANMSIPWSRSSRLRYTRCIGHAMESHIHGFFSVCRSVPTAPIVSKRKPKVLVGITQTMPLKRFTR